MSTSQQLPGSIGSITLPQWFHPSAFRQLELCPLSVVGHDSADLDGLLTITPLAYLGIVIHHVRHEVMAGRWGGAENATAAADQILSMTLETIEQALRGRPATAELAPLFESVGRKRWKGSTRDLRDWAASLDHEGGNEAPRLPDVSERVAGGTRATREEVSLGSERSIASPTLRLRGRLDWSSEVDQGRVEIVDFKSGRVKDREGRLLGQHAAQVQLYALMMENLLPGVTVSPFVEQRDRIPVPWGPIERQDIRERLSRVSSRLPAGDVVDAAEIASPGAHCRNCRLRPQCRAYLEATPRWWRDAPEHPRPLPMDVWGSIVRMAGNGATQSLWLVDAADRRVRIDGLRAASLGETVDVGDCVWIFDLEASEDTNQHGAIVHPRNFHQRPPGPQWVPALRVRAFVGMSTDAG